MLESAAEKNAEPPIDIVEIVAEADRLAAAAETPGPGLRWLGKSKNRAQQQAKNDTEFHGPFSLLRLADQGYV